MPGLAAPASRIPERAAAVIAAIAIPLLLSSAVRRVFDRDEIETIHSAWKMTAGETLYVDFFQHHHPLL